MNLGKMLHFSNGIFHLSIRLSWGFPQCSHGAVEEQSCIPQVWIPQNHHTHQWSKANPKPDLKAFFGWLWMAQQLQHDLSCFFLYVLVGLGTFRSLNKISTHPGVRSPKTVWQERRSWPARFTTKNSQEPPEKSLDAPCIPEIAHWCRQKKHPGAY